MSLHKGLFEDTWPMVATKIHQIALAHVDCDWYDPVKYCLECDRGEDSAWRIRDTR